MSQGTQGAMNWSVASTVNCRKGAQTFTVPWVSWNKSPVPRTPAVGRNQVIPETFPCLASNNFFLKLAWKMISFICIYLISFYSCKYLLYGFCWSWPMPTLRGYFWLSYPVWVKCWWCGLYYTAGQNPISLPISPPSPAPAPPAFQKWLLLVIYPSFIVSSSERICILMILSY